MKLMNSYDANIMEEINELIDGLDWQYSRGLIEDLRSTLIENYNQGNLNLDDCLMSLGYFESARESEKALIRVVEWDQGFDNNDIMDILTDFKWFIRQLSDNYIFYHEYTLLDIAEEFLRQDIADGSISERLANFIDMDLYCNNLEDNGYIETEDGVLYY